MTPNLRSAALVSVACHGLLFFPGWITQPPSVDVQRGPVSLEVELFSEARATPSETARHASVRPDESESWLQHQDQPPVRQHPPMDTAAGHGAFLHAQPHGARNRPPAYPWLARIRGLEGTVMLRVHVEMDGHPSAVWVIRSSGYPILDEAAQRAIQHWEFLPAHQGGRAVSSEVELPVRFRLTSSKADSP